MNGKKITSPLSASIRGVAGSTLYQVKVSAFHVEFCFIDSIRVIIQINKQFGFCLNGGEPLCFIANSESPRTQSGNASFVLMVGRRCVDAEIGENKLSLSFDGGDMLWVDYDETDFEPLLITGISEDGKDNLEFLWAL